MSKPGDVDERGDKRGCEAGALPSVGLAEAPDRRSSLVAGSLLETVRPIVVLICPRFASNGVDFGTSILDIAGGLVSDHGAQGVLEKA